MMNVAAHSRTQTGRLSCQLVQVVACIAAVFLGGCLARPPDHSEIVNKSLPKGASIPDKWSASNGANIVVSDNWLETLHDPGLDAVVADAIKNNLDLQQAAERVKIARQTVIVVGAQLKPQVGAQFSGAATQAIDPSNTFKSNMEYGGASWEVDVWGRLRSEQAAARANFESVSLDYSFARQSLAATAAKSWYLTIESRQLFELAEQSVGIYADLLKLARVQASAGKVSDLNVAEASASLNEAESQSQRAQGLYSESRRNLEVLVGRYPGAELKVSESFVPIPPPVEAGLPASLTERRPDLVAAERQVLATFRTLEATKLALRPDIALTVEGGRVSDRLLDLLLLNPILFRSAVQVFVPIYEGGALRAKIRIATAQQGEALAAYGSAALNAFREVEIALTNEALLAGYLKYEQDALHDRAEAVRIATLKYKAGATDLLSALQLQTDQIATQAELIKARNAQLANRINLHLALGGSFNTSPAVTPPNMTGMSFQVP
jgi:NodT family efflux transporter outer membrane factor (OMF) lipoprotein